MSRKTFIATIITVFLASMLTRALLFNVAIANPLPQNPINPPPILIQSPLNSTYYQNDILLNFTIVNASTYSPMVYHLEVIYYRIDEKPVWIYSNPNNYQPNTEQFSANLTGLSEGEHTLTVYVDGGGLYYINNSSQIQGYSVESTQTVTFTVTKDLETTPADAPMWIEQTPRDNATFSVSGFLLNFTVMKPDSWDLTASGRIEYIDVTLNGYEKFHDSLSSDPLNGTGSWSKNYSISIDGLELGTNTLAIIISATPTPNESSLTVMGKMNLNFLEPTSTPTLNPSATSILTPLYSSNPFQEPSPNEAITPNQTMTPTPNNTQENFTPVPIIADIVVAVVVVGLLVYFARHKKGK